MRTRAASVAYVGCVAVLVLAFVALVVPGFAFTRLWEDEAYNLSVPLNLARGNGYTSFGALVGSIPTAFDYRISTGPVVLLPIALPLLFGLDPAAAGRAVMVAFAVLLVAAAFAVGRRSGGRWGGVAAVAVVLAFNGGITDSPLQGLTDVLGEVPAAAFTLLAVFWLRDRPWLSGLSIGLAIQCKNLAVLSLPALLLVLVVTTASRIGARARAAVTFIAFALVPTVLFEVVKLLVLGFSDYRASTRDAYYFLRSGGQSGFNSGPLDKVQILLGAWGLPAVIVAFVLIGLVVIAVFDLRHGPGLRAGGWLLAGLLFVSWCGWWLSAVHQPVWIRHPSPGALVVAALAAGLGVGAARAFYRDHWAPSPRGRSRLVLGVAGVVAFGLLGWAVGGRITAAYHPVGESLAEQRAVAQLADRLPSDRLRGDWGPMVPIALLADRQPVLAGDDSDTDGTWLLPIWRDVDREELARAGAERACGPDTSRIDGGYVYCTAAD